MSSKEERDGPLDDPGGSNNGGAIPKTRPPLSRSTEEGAGYSSVSPSSRVRRSGGDSTLGQTPPSIKPTGAQGSLVKIVNLEFDTVEKSPRGSKMVNSATGGFVGDVPGLDTCVHSRTSDSVPGSTSEIPLIAIEHDRLNLGSLDKDARPDGTSTPIDKSLNKDVTVIEGREYVFNRQGWARYSRDMLINREGFKRKMYKHERSNWNAQERFDKERSKRQTAPPTRGQPPHMRNETRTSYLRRLHQEAQQRSGRTPAQDRKRARPLSGETGTAPDKKVAKGGKSVFSPPTAIPVVIDDDMEEEQEDPQEEPEGRAYWAQYGVRSNTCRIFATNETRLDDVDITYLSQMMVRKRDKDFQDVNDPEVLAASDKISVDRIGKSGKHIRVRLITNEGIEWWRNFVNSVPPIDEGSAQRGHRYRFFAPGESMFTYFRVWLTDGTVGDEEIGQAYLEREIARGNPQLRGVAWKVKVVGSDGGKVVVKLALPSASAYSLVESMEYRLRYGMDKLEIVPTTRSSIASAMVPGPRAGVDGAAGGGSRAPPAKEASAEPKATADATADATTDATVDPKTTTWRDKEESYTSRDSDLETSTETVIDTEEQDKLLDTDTEMDTEKTSGNEQPIETASDTVNDPGVVEQNRL